MPRETLGDFEVMVLLAAMRLGEKAYGLSIAEEISSTARRATGRASVYVALRRLEKKALISTRWEDPGEAASGKPRRFITVRPEAVTLLGESRRALHRMWSGLERELEEA